MNSTDHLFILRSMFYFLTPNETYYDQTNKVPDLIQKSSTLFFGFMLIEQIVFILKYGKSNARLDDVITSAGSGMLYLLPNLFFREINIITYEYIYFNFKVYDLTWNSKSTYLITLLFTDMMFYWFHRASHEVNFLWAAHQVHHSSEDYNLSTALRKSVVQKYTSWIFYLPMAMFIKPSVFIIHSHMNLLYQFWIHTELIDSLGPFEYVLNTASHHRVHHGRNSYCIDRNYAGVFIIWDRLFGTFEAEKKDQVLAYGLVHPIESYDPIYIQVFNYKHLLEKLYRAKNLSDKFSILFKGPGWVPGSGRLGHSSYLPKVDYPIQKYTYNHSKHLNFYIGCKACSHLLFCIV